MKYLKPVLIVLLILIIDQALKIWIKSNMFLGEEIVIFDDWFILHFTENNGIAFGVEFAGRIGKLALTLFRMVAAGFIGFFLFSLIKKKAAQGLIFALSLVLAGALGNILDSVFYGVIFDYESIFHGRVVDMFYFPLWQGTFPEWLPFWGGENFLFFRPVFNVADSAITVGVIWILLFHRGIFEDI